MYMYMYGEGMDLELCGDHEGRRLECLDENTRGAWGVNGSGVNIGLVWLHGLGFSFMPMVSGARAPFCGFRGVG